MAQNGDSKPILPLLGVPLIERVIRSAIKPGIDSYCVVTGFNGDKVRHFLDGLARRCQVEITHIVNDEWEKGNGLSVLKARDYLKENFVLLMADHLFDPEILHMLAHHPPGIGEITLVVDRNTGNPLVDIADVTKVKVEDGQVVDIGKDIASSNGFDTGIFLCTPAIFKALEQSISEHGDTSLTGGVRCLAREGKVNALDIDERFWIDVDDPAAFRKAEKALLDHLRDKSNDGPVSRYLNRPVSVMFSRRLTRFNISPNQISLFSFLCSVLAAGLFALGGYAALLLGGVLAQFASIIDGCDGEVARLKYQSSDYGGWFDAVLDRYADAFLLLGLTWHLLTVSASGLILFAGFMAIIGSFMLSYTADKYDNLMRKRIDAGGRAGLRMGRDVRVFLISLGAVANLVLPVLVFIAVIMNLETLRRLIVVRDG